MVKPYLITLFICLTILGKGFAQAPIISSFSPQTGSSGTLVTISRTNLNNPINLNIGGIAAIIVSSTNTHLVGMVMPGATSGSLSIKTTGGTATGSANFTIIPTPYPSTPQGGKLIGTGGAGSTGYMQGQAVSISADGNTAVVGAPQDDNGTGALWVYTRNNNSWTQQGAKLTGINNIGARLGCSVAISADGNTIITGGSQDNGDQGAAWVFTRNGNIWTQQGNKLIGTGNVGNAGQGYTVALSADGNTALMAGSYDNNNYGAVWVFTRTGDVWSQQGSKIPGTDLRGSGREPQSLAISADGKTFIIGNSGDNGNSGPTVVYANINGIWLQQAKLVGTDVVGHSSQGESVALSADGNIAIVGGSSDSSFNGAAWIYKRNSGTWTQQGTKLVGKGNVGASGQGTAVALSADGNTAMVTGPGDNGGLVNSGATWVYRLLNGVWKQQGEKLVTNFTTSPGQGSSISISADGSTAIIGASADNAYIGEACIFIAVPAPKITSFSPATATSGTKIKISGFNFTNITGVDFGNVPAQSFTVDSSTMITAIVGTGSSGYVSVTSSSGTDSLSGFNFVPKPIVILNRPATFLKGDSVVFSVNPSTGFSYQWLKNGSNIPNATGPNYTAKESGTYTVSISLNSISAVSDPVIVDAIFTLPPSNFKLTITSASCRGSSDGLVNITATQNLNYTATITGNGLNSLYPFTTTAAINGLAAGTYNICITVADQPGYSQCYDVVITEPQDLSVYSTINPDNSITLALGGGNQYNINLNGLNYATSANSITLPLAQGSNDLTVTTDRLCQGTFQKLINNSGNITPYPVPFQNTLNVNLGNKNINKVTVEIHNVSDGKLVYTKQYINQSGVLQLDVTGLNNSVYVLHLTMDNSEKIFKVIKK